MRERACAFACARENVNSDWQRTLAAERAEAIARAQRRAAELEASQDEEQRRLAAEEAEAMARAKQREEELVVEEHERKSKIVTPEDWQRKLLPSKQRDSQVGRHHGSIRPAPSTRPPPQRSRAGPACTLSRAMHHTRAPLFRAGRRRPGVLLLRALRRTLG